MKDLRKSIHYNSRIRNSKPLSINDIVALFSFGIIKGDAKFLNEYVKNKKYRSLKDLKDYYNMALLVSTPLTMESIDYKNLDLFDIDSASKYLLAHYSTIADICRNIPIPNYLWQYYDSDEEFNLSYLLAIIESMYKYNPRYIKIFERVMIENNYRDFYSIFAIIYFRSLGEKKDSEDNFSFEYTLEDVIEDIKSKDDKVAALSVFENYLKRSSELKRDALSENEVCSILDTICMCNGDEVPYGVYEILNQILNNTIDEYRKRIMSLLVDSVIRNDNVKLAIFLIKNNKGLKRLTDYLDGKGLLVEAMIINSINNLPLKSKKLNLRNTYY